MSLHVKDTSDDAEGYLDATHHYNIHESVSVLDIFLNIYSERGAHHGLQKQFLIDHTIVAVWVRRTRRRILVMLGPAR